MICYLWGIKSIQAAAFRELLQQTEQQFIHSLRSQSLITSVRDFQQKGSLYESLAVLQKMTTRCSLSCMPTVFLITTCSWRESCNIRAAERAARGAERRLLSGCTPSWTHSVTGEFRDTEDIFVSEKVVSRVFLYM